jgi:PPOX class probable F420-dependent enzyme
MPEPLLDPNRADDAHTAARLSGEPVIWLGTAGADGRPHQVPVWFCWRDPMVLIFSMPGTRKLRELERNPLVTLNLDSAAGGQDVVLAEGQAVVGAEGQAVAGAEEARGGWPELAGALGDKYAGLLGDGGLEQWRETFSVPILVTVSKIVAWRRQKGQLAYRSVP